MFLFQVYLKQDTSYLRKLDIQGPPKSNLGLDFQTHGVFVPDSPESVVEPSTQQC